MSLVGQQRKRLQDALVSAFPTKASLEQMLSFELERNNLEAIAGGDNLQDIVFNLIQTAESQGWLLDLVGAACKANSGNSQLQAIAQELLTPPALPDIVTGDSTQTASFQNEYCEWLIRKCQNYRTEGLSQLGSLLLPDVFVPLKVAANYVENARPEMIPLRDTEINSQKTIWDFLVAAAGKTSKLSQRCTVVLGAPGAGKSTLLKHLTFVYANIEQKKYSEEAPELVPVLLLIRKVYQEIVKKQPPLADLIAEQAKDIIEENQTPQPLSEWFSEELKQGRCLVMLDGLDEVADESQRKLVSEWVDKQIERYHKNIFLLTSRPRGYRDASLKNAHIVLEVQPFNLERVRSFIHKWYLETEKIRSPTDEISEIKKHAQEQAEGLINQIRNSSPLAAMAMNPLLLTMISTVHHKLSLENRSLPEKRVDLYKEMCEVLLEKRQKDKEIPDTFLLQDKQSVLQVLALKLMQKEDTKFELSKGISWIQWSTKLKLSKGISCIQRLVATVDSNDFKPEKIIEYIHDISGLLVEHEEQCYQFAHLSFQEYLAACQIEKSKKDKLLISNIGNSWWAETIRLYAAQSDATTLIRAVLDMKSPSVDVMALAYDCLEECLRVDAKVRQQLIQRLENGLESTDPKTFKLAARVRLIRRFRNFVRINEELEIDNSYITCAEYQLFLDETRDRRQPQHWQSNRFPAGDAKKTMTGISRENALRFCVWLGELYRTRLGNELSEMAVHYRLPLEEEIDRYSINDDQQFLESGIRLVKFQVPSRYSQLADYLWSGEWKRSDEETASVMLQVAGRESQNSLDTQDVENFPCEDLRIIDQLWVYASKRRFGFSVQKKIYQSSGGKGISAYLERIGWRDVVLGTSIEDAMSYTLDVAPEGHLPTLLLTTSLDLVQNELNELRTMKLRNRWDDNSFIRFKKEVFRSGVWVGRFGRIRRILFERTEICRL